MSDALSAINFDEAAYFYKNPHALVDYSQMQSFSLIKSSIEIFAYYGLHDFSAADIKAFFEKIALVQKKNQRVFVPSAKKVSGVLDCCLLPSDCCLSADGDRYHIEHWNTDGYRYEILAARQKNLL